MTVKQRLNMQNDSTTRKSIYAKRLSWSNMKKYSIWIDKINSISQIFSFIICKISSNVCYKASYHQKDKYESSIINKIWSCQLSAQKVLAKQIIFLALRAAYVFYEYLNTCLYNFIELLLFYLTMKRPASAKPGHKGQWGQYSAEDITDPQTNGQLERKPVRIMRPDLTTHDFARILPRRIQQDKQRLYSQGLQLKQKLHEVVEENMRLKTKITRNWVDLLRLHLKAWVRAVDQVLSGQVRYSFLTQKDNMIVRNLKKIVREGRQENENLRAEAQKIKKTMKYTKINELEIQRKMLSDENKRIGTLLEQYSSQVLDQQELQRENYQLKKHLEQQIDERNQIDEQRENYEEIIDSLQEKLKAEAEKFASREKKLQRQLHIQRRKLQDLQRKNDEFYRQLKNLREAQQYLQQKHRKTVKTNIRTSKVQKGQKLNTQQSQPSDSDKKYAQLRRNNEQLSRQLQSVKEKLKKAQEADVQEQSSKVNINQSNLQFSRQKDFQEEASPSKVEDKPEQQPEVDYEEAFEKEAEGEVQESKNESQIERLKKDFEENEEEEQLYKKQDKPKRGKTNKNQKSGKNDKNEKVSKGETYKSNKKILSQIKQLLTYRMKSQRYPFNDIKSDIQSAQTTQFSYSDLCNMLVNEPFYLNSDYTRTFLSYCFDKERVQPTESIPSAVLVAKLRRVIDDFQLMEQNQQKQMIIRIAEMTSTYPRQLQVAFQNIKNGQDTVGRQDLIDMFKKLQLEDKYIQLIIAQLSLCSDDLEHLNFHGFFQRFYIEDEGQEYLDNNAIEQEESQQSYKHSSRVRKQPHRGKNDEEQQGSAQH